MNLTPNPWCVAILLHMFLFLTCPTLTYGKQLPPTILELCKNDGPVDLLLHLQNPVIDGGTWNPSFISGTNIFDPAKDTSGLYEYTVTSPDNTVHSIQVELLIPELPNAGTGAEISLCITDDPTDLFLVLGNNPQPGGVWVPDLSGNDGFFDPDMDAEGVYTYFVSNSCGTTYSEVEVRVLPLLNPGNDGSLSICSNSGPVDLFDHLEGSPDRGGRWTPGLSSGTGIFNPLIDHEGEYMYETGNANCGYDSATVTVSFAPSSYAGEDITIDVCANSHPINLYDYLGLNVDDAGSWSPVLSSGSGWLDPVLDSSGSYTYTTENGYCGTDRAVVTVNIQEEPDFPSVEIMPTEMNGNYEVYVNMENPQHYEFSIDNTVYQPENVFKNISPGNHTVSIRQQNGCGYYRQSLILLGYPKYFTPNGDGVNDFWRPSTTNEDRYKLTIFDRYGRPISQLTEASYGWDGSYNGNPLPSADYWFEIRFVDGSTSVGHFCLTR